MKIKVHKDNDASYIRNSDLTEEDQELFGIFNLGATCPYLPGEGHLSYAHDYERYLDRKESYIKRYEGLNEFRAALKKYCGYVPYAD